MDGAEPTQPSPAAPSGELTIKGDVETLRLGPGDVLLITFHEVHTQERFAQMIDLLEAALERVGIPKERWVAVAGEKASFKVVKKDQKSLAAGIATELARQQRVGGS
jgi:protein involved in polysaccharide export with SLBB domain